MSTERDMSIERNLDAERDFWQQLANTAAAERPSVGKLVLINRGRKHKGKVGTVTRHQRDAYSDAFRYGDSSSHFLKECRGRDGYIVLVKTEENETFWVKADYAEIIG